MWYITTYSSRYHYGVRIEELCDGFQTRGEAVAFGKSIAENRPEYCVILQNEDRTVDEVI